MLPQPVDQSLMGFLRTFLIYGLGGGISRLAALILVPLYTRTLSQTEFGQFEVVLAAQGLIVILGGMQLESVLARDYFSSKESGTLNVLAWGAIILSIGGILICGLLALVALLSGWLPSEYNLEILVLTIGAAASTQILGLQLLILRFDGKPSQYALFSIIDLLTCALFSYVLIVVYKFGLVGAMCALIGSKSVAVLLAWSNTYNSLRFVWPSSKSFLAQASYGLPLVPAVIVNWVQGSGMRILVALTLSLTDVALAGIAMKVAAIYGFLVYCFRLAWEPYSFSKIDDKESGGRKLNASLEWFVAIMFFGCGLVVIFGPLIASVLAPPEYALSGYVACFFIWGQFWIGVTNIVSIGVHESRKTILLIPIFGYGALANLVVFLALYSVIGVNGAGISVCVGAVISALFATYYTNNYSNIHFKPRLIFATLAGMLIMVGFWQFKSLNYTTYCGEFASCSWALLVEVVGQLCVTAIMMLVGLGRARMREMASEALVVLRYRG
jgi:O-antigen/teichoic acid export membrane protein